LPCVVLGEAGGLVTLSATGSQGLKKIWPGFQKTGLLDTIENSACRTHVKTTLFSSIDKRSPNRFVVDDCGSMVPPFSLSSPW
jgi:hypothetical protein